MLASASTLMRHGAPRSLDAAFQPTGLVDSLLPGCELCANHALSSVSALMWIASCVLAVGGRFAISFENARSRGGSPKYEDANVDTNIAAYTCVESRLSHLFTVPFLDRHKPRTDACGTG